ncbi:MAG: helicase-related protein, partial [Planctomycetota bacterium]
CTELRVDLPQDLRLEYALSTLRAQVRIAAENPAKFDVVRRLVERHRGGRVLIIGQYLAQLHKISDELGAPIITGKTRNAERDRLFEAFRTGEVPLLIVSKVGNFAVDLPDANVAIQVSGTFGSRQEEAQRLGRILRPKSDGTMARFYAIVTRDTKDQDFASNRSLFLTEQGYSYQILNADEV